MIEQLFITGYGRRFFFVAQDKELFPAINIDHQFSEGSVYLCGIERFFLYKLMVNGVKPFVGAKMVGK